MGGTQASLGENTGVFGWKHRRLFPPWQFLLPFSMRGQNGLPPCMLGWRSWIACLRGSADTTQRQSRRIWCGTWGNRMNEKSRVERGLTWLERGMIVRVENKHAGGASSGICICVHLPRLWCLSVIGCSAWHSFSVIYYFFLQRSGYKWLLFGVILLLYHLSIWHSPASNHVEYL